MSHSYRDLVVWQEAKALAVAVYRCSEQQLCRAAGSVASNIAEGQGRLMKGEFVQFLGHSRGSILELVTQLEIAIELGYLTPSDFQILDAKASNVLRLLNGLIGSIRAKSKAAMAN